MMVRRDLAVVNPVDHQGPVASRLHVEDVLRTLTTTKILWRDGFDLRTVDTP